MKKNVLFIKKITNMSFISRKIPIFALENSMFCLID